MSAPPYRLEQGKPLQDGPKANVTPDMLLLGIATDALPAWLADAALTEGPIFRRLWGNTVGPGLSSKAIADIVQKRAQLAGVEILAYTASDPCSSPKAHAKALPSPL